MLWKRVKRPLEVAEHVHFVDFVVEAIFHWHSWALGLGTTVFTIFVGAADGKSVSDVWVAALIAGAAVVLIAAGISACLRRFWPRRAPIREAATTATSANVVAGPFQITVGEDGPFCDVPKYNLYSFTRRLKIELRNIDPFKTASDCKVQITKIEPYSGYRGPWVLSENFKLTAGDQRYIPVAEFNEARDRQKFNCADDTIAVCAGAKSPLLQTETENVLTIRATGHDVPFLEVECTVWIDSEGHIKIAKRGADENFIPLVEAATRAYELTRDDHIASVAVAHDSSPAGIIRWYCYALVIPRDHGPLMKLFGARPPSRVREPVTFLKSHAVNVRPWGAYLIEGKNDVFADLCVRSDELQRAVDAMKSWSRESVGA